MKAKMKKVLKSNKGFTMIELMVVIVIMLILAAIAIPSFNRLITQANEAAATAEVRTVLTLAQLEAEMIIVEDGKIDDVSSASKGTSGDASACITETAWEAILVDAGISADADQAFFSFTIEDGVVTVYYDNGNDVTAQLPEAEAEAED